MSFTSLKGRLLKMQSEFQSPVKYALPLGDHLLPLNPLIGQVLRMKFEGKILDIYDGKPIKKSYGQGYSYKNFITLARCDSCIVKPELCHFERGTCREPEWGEANCFIPHYIYLANTSGLKVGITRETQIPTRWIDQGAISALPLLKVPNRKASGLIEIEIKKEMNDKTNWRQMLKGDVPDIDLLLEKENLFDSLGEGLGDLLDYLSAQEIEANVTMIQYPVQSLPPKINSLGFDKNPLVEGTLLGIKGQYLIFDTGVLNIRKHQGHVIELKTEN